MAFVETLIVAYILTLFNLDNILPQAINEIFASELSSAFYWVCAVVIALIRQSKSDSNSSF